MRRVACVILAAGLGKRYGGPKAEAQSDAGIRFLDLVIELARNAGLDPVVAVVGSNTMVPADVRGVVNPRGEGEQIETARLGLAAVDASLVESGGEDVMGTMLWPVDHPFVEATTVRALIESISTSDPDVAVPVHDGRRGHPVYFARRRWENLRGVADGGARAVLRSLGPLVVEVPVNDAGVLADIDTPDALSAWRAAHSPS